MLTGDAAQQAAARATRGTGSALPYLDRIQRLFGRHDVTGIRAYVGNEAAQAAQALGAMAFATGDRVAFAEPPTLETAAHEAAHVVQQRGGVQLTGGMGQAGDPYEANADAVAARVAAGESAEALLDPYAASAGAHQAPAVQCRKVVSELHGELVTEQLTGKQLVAIYKELRRIEGNKETIAALKDALEKVEYKGPRVDVSRIDGTRRNLKQVIDDNQKNDYQPDLDEEHTVGFEVEFGYHQNPLLNFTHIELARSAKGAWINQLPFKLETDSGSTVEIVTPPLWVSRAEQDLLQAELEAFAKGSVTTPVTIADWIKGANTSYAMALVPVPADEIRRGVNMFNVDEGADIKQAKTRARSETLIDDIGATVLGPSQKDPSGAHTQTNKAISLADYGAQRAALHERIRADLAVYTEDQAFLEEWLNDEGNDMWDEAFRDPSVDVNAINATIMLLNRKRKQQPPDPGSASYLWQSHMQSVAQIFRLAQPIPEKVENPFGVPPPDNTGPLATLIGEKSVTGALGTIGENLQYILQKHAWAREDPSLLKVQDDDSLTRRKGKAMASWHSSVKDCIGSWFKGDLRQVLLQEAVAFPIARTPGALEQHVMKQWEQNLAVQMVPYMQTLALLGVKVDGDGVITETSDAWLKLPLPEPRMYRREWAATIRSIYRLIEETTAARKHDDVNSSFDPPRFLDHFNDHLYNPREDTMISSQYVVRFPTGGEHQYVLEKR